MHISIISIGSSWNRNREEGTFSACAPIDSKIQEFALERIGLAKEGLLATAMAPQIVLDLLPAFELAKQEHASNKHKKKNKMYRVGKKK